MKPYKEKCQAPWWPYSQATGTIFKLVQYIIGTNLLTMKNVTSPWQASYVFPPTETIFKLFQDIIGTNQLTKFHDDWKMNVASRVLISHITKNSPPPGGHVFKTTETIFELLQDIIGTNLLTKFHEDRKIKVASRVLTRKIAPPPGGHVFQQTRIIFKRVQDIIGMNFLTKFHEDLTINVASRVKNAPPLDSHVFQANVTIFELIQNIIETNLLTKFLED
ncbi:hypothetical protein DPMN_087729 [Dreissena polymorpha]|uniref:Uncharacterized protein n=1 Tax=Dreissena polymorpha TaxID=45954 RepID=A0A9D4KTQ2_DREPO|nr:hypothetical protein DPMN_087729 [Dreissena polymorpha]